MYSAASEALPYRRDPVRVVAPPRRRPIRRNTGRRNIDSPSGVVATEYIVSAQPECDNRRRCCLHRYARELGAVGERSGVDTRYTGGDDHALERGAAERLGADSRYDVAYGDARKRGAVVERAGADTRYIVRYGDARKRVAEGERPGVDHRYAAAYGYARKRFAAVERIPAGLPPILWTVS